METRGNPSWFRFGGVRLSLYVIVLWVAFSALFIGYVLYKSERAREMFARIFENETELQPELHDRLLPVKKMFAEAGEQNKERDKTLNSSSIEVPLTDLREIGNKTQVLLLVIVLTGPKTQERRTAIRETWWRKCIGEVKCVFLTDGLQLEENQKKSLLKERNIFGDIFFSPTQTGAVIYGHRFLYLAMWAKAKFNFQYLLRLDDDYFVCMDRLLNELPFRPKTSLSWGWYHCDWNIVRMDEAWSLFSEDVIQNFLAQDPRSMLCHPFGGQMIALWKHAIGINNLTEFNDHRLHHTPPARKMKKFFSVELVCDKYVGVHGSYYDLMHHLWNNSNDGPKTITSMRLLRDTCSVPNVFDVNKIGGVYRHKPKPCIEGFRWGPIPWRSSEN